MLGEQHFLADFLAHPIVLPFLQEVLTQPGRRHIGNDRLGVRTRAPDSDGTFINVGGEHLDLDRIDLQLLMLGTENRQAIGFFAG
ncbi:hypothetical protein D3C80_1385520 [compost metagenome]